MSAETEDEVLEGARELVKRYREAGSTVLRVESPDGNSERRYPLTAREHRKMILNEMASYAVGYGLSVPAGEREVNVEDRDGELVYLLRVGPMNSLDAMDFHFRCARPEKGDIGVTYQDLGENYTRKDAERTGKGTWDDLSTTPKHGLAEVRLEGPYLKFLEINRLASEAYDSLDR